MEQDDVLKNHEYMVGSDVDYQEKAKKYVRDYVIQQNRQYSNLPDPEFTVYVIWWSKTLQNWKGVFGTTLPDGKMYELTHDGDKKTTYFDAYAKLHNFAITEPE
jgi:hypothetical protein